MSIGLFFGITAETAASKAKLFLVLACVWFLMAFVSRRRKILNALVYGVFGLLFMAVGIFALVTIIMEVPFPDKKAAAAPAGILVVLVCIISFGISRIIKEPDIDEDTEKEIVAMDVRIRELTEQLDGGGENEDEVFIQDNTYSEDVQGINNPT